MVEWILNNLALITLAWTGLLSFVVFYLRSTYAKRDDHIALENKVKLIESNMPDINEFHALRLEISELRGDIKGIEPDLLTVKKLADMLLENELLNSKGDK